MKLYQIQHPTLISPLYAVGLEVAGLVAQDLGAIAVEVPDTAGPPGAALVDAFQAKGGGIWGRIGRFPVGCMPQHIQLLLERFQTAEKHSGYFIVSSDRDRLCVAPPMRQQFIANIEKLQG